MLTLSYTVRKGVDKHVKSAIVKALKTPYTVKYAIRGGYLSVDTAIARITSLIECVEKKIEYLSAAVIAFGLLSPLGIAIIGSLGGRTRYVTLAQLVSATMLVLTLAIASRDKYMTSLVSEKPTCLALTPTFVAAAIYFVTGSILASAVASALVALPFVVRSRSPDLTRLKSVLAGCVGNVYVMLSSCRACRSNSRYLIYGDFDAGSIECVVCYTSVKLVEELGSDPWVMRSLASIIDSFETAMHALKSRLLEVQAAAVLTATLSLVLSMLTPYYIHIDVAGVNLVTFSATAALARLGSRSVWVGIILYSACTALSTAHEVVLWSMH